jgi:hypothetical protein
MSTPSGKLPHLVDLGTHVERKTRHTELEQPVERGHHSPPRSPYAPKPPDERAAARLRVLAKEGAENVLLAYAPKRARLSQSGAVATSDTNSPASASLSPNERPTAAPPQDASGQVFVDDAPPLSPESSGSIQRRPDGTLSQVDPSSTLSQQESGKRCLEPAAISSLQPREAADNERNKQRKGEMHQRTIAGREIERVEDILRELKRRELPNARLPRGPNLPPPEPILVAPDAAGSVLGRRSGHLDSFESTRLPPPLLQPMHYLRVILGISIACVGAALACWYFVSPPSSQPTLNSQMASRPPSSAASISTGASSRGPRLDSEPGWAPRISDAQSDLVQAKNLPERNTGPEAVIASQPPANTQLESIGKQTATPSPSKAVRALQPEEIRLLVQQGEKFISDGDIVTARVIFERAAKAGDAAAALALAAAYDPFVLAKLGVLGIDTDVEKARIWYEKAQNLGAAQAADRLNALVRR